MPSPSMRLTTRLAPAICAIVLAATALTALPGHAATAAKTCLSAPNAATPQGKHWYYHWDRVNRRKCWYLGEKGKAIRRDPVQQSDSAATPVPPARPQVKPARQQPYSRASQPAEAEVSQPAEGEVSQPAEAEVSQPAPAQFNGDRSTPPPSTDARAETPTSPANGGAIPGSTPIGARWPVQTPSDFRPSVPAPATTTATGASDATGANDAESCFKRNQPLGGSRANTSGRTGCTSPAG